VITEAEAGFSRPKHSGKSEVSVEISRDPCAAAKGIIGVLGPDVSSEIDQLAD
jgi:hypothetical protein